MFDRVFLILVHSVFFLKFFVCISCYRRSVSIMFYDYFYYLLGFVRFFMSLPAGVWFALYVCLVMVMLSLCR